MPTASDLGWFALAALVLVLIPGPSVLYIVARGASQGWRAGLVSACGVQTGSLVHIAAAVCGLSAVLVASAAALTAVKVIGGSYLIYLGVRSILTAGNGDPATVATVAPRPLAKIYRDGIVVNALNPKTAVFFLAFLPQFVHPERGPVAVQLLILGLVFVVVGLCSDGTYGVVSGLTGDALRRRRPTSNGRTTGRLTGVLYIALGGATLASGSHTA